MGSTHPYIFFQLKNIFHKIESIGSARIEGNHTTVAEYIDADISNSEKNEDFLEIKNNELALDFIEDNIDKTPINRAFISEIHKLVVNDLNKEGSKTPGSYRLKNIKISGSKHIPPDYLLVNDLMDELLHFINSDDKEKYDLIKIALAHHRFVWIHPFDNGNGRTVRLLTYAMLIKMGFKVRSGRIINPTAIFCSNRDHYYNALGKADDGSESGLLYWTEYMLAGLSTEIQKIDNLLEYDYTKQQILIPTLVESHRKQIITSNELKQLKFIIDNQPFKTTQLREIYKDKRSDELSRMVKQLRDKDFLIPETESSRQYIFNFIGNSLMREIIRTLDKEGFLPFKDEI